jgi:hypothetical protein
MCLLTNTNQDTRLPLNKLHSENFPLPTLGPKIRKLSVLLANEQPYFLIRGLKPQWFSKIKNVVVYIGIASHVGTRHAMAAGDHNVLRKHEYHLSQMKKKFAECVGRSYHRYQHIFGERGHHLPWPSKQGYSNRKSLKSKHKYKLIIGSHSIPTMERYSHFAYSLKRLVEETFI